MQRTAANTGLAREYKNVFELGNVPAYEQFYDFGIFPWKWIYRGFYKPWHLIPAPTIQNPKAQRQAYRMNAGKAVCAELAGLVWGEKAEIHVTQKGYKPNVDDNGEVTNPDPLDAFIQCTLAKNAFGEKMQEAIEQGLALGG